MERRPFLRFSLAASAAALASVPALATQNGTQAVSPREATQFYLLRHYKLRSGPQLKRAETYFALALLPALGRMGLGPVGAFKIDVGEESPAYDLLIPGSSAAALAELDFALASDREFLAAAEPFWKARAADPAFESAESSLLRAFPGWPRLRPPTPGTKKLFQLRTYQSPSNFDHLRKVEMFHSGEFDLFLAAGFHPVFFGDALVGSRLPSLTYMLAFADLAELDAQWNHFRNDPGWKKLSADPRFAFDNLVSTIRNVYLSPLDCSQI